MIKFYKLLIYYFYILKLFCKSYSIDDLSNNVQELFSDFSKFFGGENPEQSVKVSPAINRRRRPSNFLLSLPGPISQILNNNGSLISFNIDVNATVSYSLLVGPSDKQCIVVEDDLAGYLKGFQLSFLYNKPENNEDAWASNLFLTIRASSNRGCYQWGGFDYEVKIIYIYIYIYIIYIIII